MSSPWSRIRARWSSTPKVVEAAKVPTAEEQAEDQKVVEKSISDAVNAVLLNEEFTKAVANHLALQIQPSIESALDISTVESKLLASNDEISKRINEIDAQITGKLSELSSLIDTNNTSTTGKISGVEKSVGDVAASLIGLESSVKTMQDQVADTSILSAHTTKLEAITAELGTIKDNTEKATALKAITAQLESIKSELEAGINAQNGDISAISAQVGSVISAVELQSGTLAEIKGTDSSADILAGLKSSNDSHAGHAAALSAIKIPSLADLEAKVDTIASTVSELSIKDVSPEILAGIKATNESLSGHSTAISEIKTIVATPAIVPEKVDLSSLVTSVQKVISDIDTQNASLSEIKSVVATPAVVEKTDMSGLENSIQKVITSLDAQNATLSEIKSAAEKENEPALESSVQKVITTLDAQAGTLSEIKTKLATPAPAAEKADLSGLESSVARVITGLDSQTATLVEIKTSVSASDTKLDNLSTEDVITEVKSIKVLVEAIPAPAPIKENDSFNTELLSEVKLVKSVVEETKKETEAIVLLVKTNAETSAKEPEPVKPKVNGENGVKVEETEVEETEVEAPAAA